MSAFAKFSIPADAGRTELHNQMNLTGCEVSYNRLPAGAVIPFVHKHKENETEVYLIVKGSGEFFVDGESTKVAAGDCVRIDPAGERCIKAGPDGLSYYCIQCIDDANIVAWREQEIKRMEEEDAKLKQLQEQLGISDEELAQMFKAELDKFDAVLEKLKQSRRSSTS